MVIYSAQFKSCDEVIPYRRVKFPAYDGTILRGNLYHRPNVQTSAPVAILVHGIGLLWIGQAENFIDAVTYALSLSEVLSDRVFAWGVVHAWGIIVMAAALDKRISSITMFLPCIDGAWDKSQWSSSNVLNSAVPRSSLWGAVQRNRFQAPNGISRIQTIRFRPLTDSEAAGDGGSVLSGGHVRDWSVVAQQMAEQ
ncbi:hypothetical protein N0V90_003815 [Kalmusia sp. IMI 367209]|nr:hypothetical protein N0V90_003815 [Kalmusia sp. IMI 367209]